MEDRFSIVTVDPSCKRFLEEEVGGVFQEGGADTGGQLLQEERSQFASHCGEALLCRGVIAGVHQSETAKSQIILQPNVAKNPSNMILFSTTSALQKSQKSTKIGSNKSGFYNRRNRRNHQSHPTHLNHQHPATYLRCRSKATHD